MRQIRAGDRRIPIIVMSASNNFETKIAALRAGANVYCEKNRDWRAIATQVSTLIQARTGARVLVVEDDPVAATSIAATLRRGGYAPRVCSDPRKFEELLLSSNPDLVLMDVHLPHVDGTELTRFLRQDQRFETVPVLYMTSDETIEDALHKPIAPHVLLATVAARLEHFRRLRALVEHDAFTGALTRRAFLEHAEAAAKNRKRICIAMIDIDDFKRVNDRHGHAAGDRVLRTLSETVVKNIGAHDFVGRYGGEEFVVLLENASERNAVLLLQEVLNQFRMLERATFSAGVAAMHDGELVEHAVARADRALYSAKRSGRNRVCVEPPP